MINNICTDNKLCVGTILNNPLDGLCQRECISVNRLFDGCIARISDDTVSIDVTDFNFTPVPPLKYLGATNEGHTAAVKNLVVMPFGDGACSRVQFDTAIPIVINCSDSVGNTGQAFGTVVQHLDIVLRVPRAAQLPYTIEASANLASSRGQFIDTHTAVLTCCSSIVVRVLGQVDLIIPAYGVAVLDTFEAANKCSALFGLPVYPEF